MVSLVVAGNGGSIGFAGYWVVLDKERDKDHKRRRRRERNE